MTDYYTNQPIFDVDELVRRDKRIAERKAKGERKRQRWLASLSPERRRKEVEQDEDRQLRADDAPSVSGEVQASDGGQLGK